MTPTTRPPSLAALVGSSAPALGGSAVPKPRFRWTTRVLLPGTVLLGALALLAYNARTAFLPAVDVRVVPVIASSEDAGRTGADAVLAQAPGWIEPAPFAISIPALTDGVVTEVLVLEGQRVEAGQVVARLLDVDAKLQLARAQAERAEAEAVVLRARADVLAAQARREEVRDELVRKRPLAETEAGGVSAGEIRRLERREAAATQEIAALEAGVSAAEASVRVRQVACDAAALALDRTQVLSPAPGVVLSRLIEPGTRLSMSAASAGAGAPGEMGQPGVIRLFDPASLQARVEVPLADAARLAPGGRAELSTELLPGRTFHGEITRVVQQANIQRNTVQFKVAIRDPDPTLKPEMLCRVKFLGRSDGEAGSAPQAGAPVIRVPASLLVAPSSGRARIWIVDLASGRPAATLRDVTTGDPEPDGSVRITGGLRPGDRLIDAPPADLQPGTRLRILGEAPEATP